MKRKASDELLRSSERVEVASSVTVVDPEGDLQIDFKKDGAPVRPLVGLLVNKHSLCLASPVFRAMLAEKSPFRQPGQKNKDGIQVVYLGDDNPACMLIIMNAIHLQGHRVPQHIKFDQLDQIAVICDKYDLGRSLGTWGHLWAKPYVDYLEDDGYARLLFIAIVFKSADVFFEVTEHLILKVSIVEGALHLEGEADDFKERVPESVLNSIAMARAGTVAQILEICHKRVRKLRHEGTPDRSFCPHNGKSSGEGFDCDVLNMGSIMHVFPDLYNDLDTSAPELRSVSALMDAVSNIRRLSNMEILTNDFKKRHADSCDSGSILWRKIKKSVDRSEGLQLEETTSLPAPEAPDWVLEDLDSVRQEYDDNLFKTVMRYTAVSNTTVVPVEDANVPADTRFRFIPMIKCLDCPERLYSYMTTPETGTGGLEEHLETELHKKRRKKRFEGNY